MGKIQILLLLSIIVLTTTKEPNNKFLAEYVKLNPPVIEGGMGLYDAFAQRESKRDFEAGTQLTLDELSQILWAGYGPNRDSGLRTVPSNKGKLGIDVYVFLEKGTFKYLPMEQKMEIINNRDYRAITGRDSFVPNASANFCFVGVLEREAYLPTEELKRAVIELDSGHVAMNMLLYCASAGLKCVPRANIVATGILGILQLDYKDYHIPLCFSAGH